VLQVADLLQYNARQTTIMEDEFKISFPKLLMKQPKSVTSANLKAVHVKLNLKTQISPAEIQNVRL
jgi:hypothetical protein